MSAQPKQYESDQLDSDSDDRQALNILNHQSELGKRKRTEDSTPKPVKKKQKSSKGDKGSRQKSKFWCLTWNNYGPNSIKILLAMRTLEKYVIQEEKGDEDGTKHLQGLLCFTKSRSLKWLKKHSDDSVHWEICQNINASVNYCQKSDTRNGQLWIKGFEKEKEKIIVVDPLEGLKLYEYQQEVLDIIDKTADARKIYWYHSAKGNIGKSALTKHMALKWKAMVIGGTWKDAYYAIAQRVAKGINPGVLIFDLPRSMENKISYTAIEGIKNGLFFSPKYESGMVIFNTPHIIIFANSPPDKSKLSKDRWVIKQLDDEKDLAHIPPEVTFTRVVNSRGQINWNNIDRRY